MAMGQHFLLQGSREKLFAFRQTFSAFRGTQRLQARPARIEYRSRREAKSDEIVTVLPRKHQIVFPAIERPAQMRTPIVDGASARAEIDALSTAVCGKREYRVSVLAMCYYPKLVRFDIVSILGRQNEALTAPAALRAAIAGHVSLFAWRQTSFYGVTARLAPLQTAAQLSSPSRKKSCLATTISVKKTKRRDNRP
jgi:hypothetical protein